VLCPGLCRYAHRTVDVATRTKRKTKNETKIIDKLSSIGKNVESDVGDASTKTKAHTVAVMSCMSVIDNCRFCVSACQSGPPASEAYGDDGVRTCAKCGHVPRGGRAADEIKRLWKNCAKIRNEAKIVA